MAGYPELVAPIVPDAQRNKSSEILLEGMRSGLAFMSQMSQQRRQQESDLAHMALQERLAGEQHALEQQKLNQAAELIPSTIKAQEARSSYEAARAKAYVEGTATEAQRKIKFNQQMEGLFEDFNSQVEKRNGNNPQFAAKQPVDFAISFINQMDEFQMASWEPRIRNGLKQMQSIADQQTVPYGSDRKPTPIWRIITHLQSADEATRVQAREDLKAAGHVRTEKVKGVPTKAWTRPIDSLWDRFIGPTDTTQEVLDDTGRGLVDKSARFQHVPSRVPPTMLPGSYAAGTSPTELPDPDLPPDMTAMDTFSPAPPAMTPKDQSALDWARAHPGDPMADAIFKKLGVQ